MSAKLVKKKASSFSKQNKHVPQQPFIIIGDTKVLLPFSSFLEICKVLPDSAENEILFEVAARYPNSKIRSIISEKKSLSLKAFEILIHDNSFSVINNLLSNGSLAEYFTFDHFVRLVEKFGDKFFSLLINSEAYIETLGEEHLNYLYTTDRDKMLFKLMDEPQFMYSVCANNIDCLVDMENPETINKISLYMQDEEFIGSLDEFALIKLISTRNKGIRVSIADKLDFYINDPGTCNADILCESLYGTNVPEVHLMLADFYETPMHILESLLKSPNKTISVTAKETLYCKENE